MRCGIVAPSLVACVLTAAVVATPAQAQDLESMRGVIRIDGSSTVYPITEAVAEEFAAVAPNVRVTVGISGTGGGFKRFTLGETDISDASRPIKGAELKIAQENGVEFIEIPVAYDGLTIVTNKANYWCDSLTVDDLKRIFLDGSKVKTWKDVRPDWPAVDLKIFAPGTDSGTFDYFKEVVAGKSGAIRSDMSVSEDDNVLVRGVAGNEGGLGFFGCAYFFANQDKIKALDIVNPETNKAVTPTAETIENGSYAPFSRPLFIYVSKKAAETKPEVNTFIDFYLNKAPWLAAEVGYVPLPRSVYSNAKANFKSRATGTQFLDAKGEKMHGPVTSVYKRLRR